MASIPKSPVAAALIFLVTTPVASAACQLGLAAGFPVTYTPDRIPIVIISIGGQPERMEVDTGAQNSFLSARAFEALPDAGMALHSTPGVYDVGLAANIQIDYEAVQSLKFGVVTFHDEVLEIGNFLDTKNNLHPLVDGLLGNDVMDQFDIGFDLPDNQLDFYLPQDCSTVQPPWAGDYASMPLTLHKETLIYTLPYIVNNKTLNAILDSGAAFSLLFKASLIANGISAESISSTSAGGLDIGAHKFALQYQKFSSVTVGAEGFANMWLPVIDGRSGDDSDALLGEDYLGSHRVLISNSTNTVYTSLMVPRQK